MPPHAITPGDTESIRDRRRGLSTLEMVLSLPILLMLMALMINFGTAASWKVRALSASRDAAWSSRPPRSGGTNPRPFYWPSDAGAGARGTADAEVLDDSRVDHPVARGPLPYGTRVDERLLDPTRGMREGASDIRRSFPMLARMGSYALRSRHPLLDDKWQYWRMGVRDYSWTGPSNRGRRIPVIYDLPQAGGIYAQDYIEAVVAIYYAPFRAALRPLDRDEEFIEYSRRFDWGTGPPDFHPRLSRFCSLDHDEAQERVTDLVDRIRGRPATEEQARIPCVAERMTDGFIGLYERVIAELEQLLDADPPPPAAEAAAIRREIAELESRIETLEAFRAQLQAGGG